MSNITIASAFNDIVTAQGGTPSADGTITGALDALNDTLSGSDQQRAETIEEAVRMLGNYIGGSQYGPPITIRCFVLGSEAEFTVGAGDVDSPTFAADGNYFTVPSGMQIFALPKETQLTENSKLTVTGHETLFTIGTSERSGVYYFAFTMPREYNWIDINVNVV